MFSSVTLMAAVGFCGFYLHSGRLRCPRAPIIGVDHDTVVAVLGGRWPVVLWRAPAVTHAWPDRYNFQVVRERFREVGLVDAYRMLEDMTCGLDELALGLVLVNEGEFVLARDSFKGLA